MIELHIESTNKKELNQSRIHSLDALSSTIDNFDAIVTEIKEVEDTSTYNTKSVYKKHYAFIIQIGMDDKPTIKYKINDKTGFIGWYSNGTPILHDA